MLGSLGNLAFSRLHHISSFFVFPLPPEFTSPWLSFDLLEVHALCHSCDLLHDLQLLGTQNILLVRTLKIKQWAYVPILLLSTDSKKKGFKYSWLIRKKCMSELGTTHICTYILVNILHHTYKYKNSYDFNCLMISHTYFTLLFVCLDLFCHNPGCYMPTCNLRYLENQGTKSQIWGMPE